MYKQPQYQTKRLLINNSNEGESIEAKVRRITKTKEPITDNVQEIYTDRNDGVGPQYNPRTDRWELAVDAMDSISKGFIAKREGKQTPVVKMEQKEDGGAESTTDATK